MNISFLSAFLLSCSVAYGVLLVDKRGSKVICRVSAKLVASFPSGSLGHGSYAVCR